MTQGVQLPNPWARGTGGLFYTSSLGYTLSVLKGQLTEDSLKISEIIQNFDYIYILGRPLT